MEYGDEKKEKLNRLEKKLYSRNAPNIIDKGITNLDSAASKANNENFEAGWNEMKGSRFDDLAFRMSKMAQSKNNFIKKFFAVSLIFFALSAGVAAFVFLGGSNMVSSRNVDIQVVGPLSVPAGQEVSFDVNVINNNNVDLKSASLLVEYPEGVRSPANFSDELDRERFQLDTIKSKESNRQNIKLVFFGEKNDLKKIKISLEYRVENSSALFYKEKLHEVVISSAPVIITPIYPKEVNSNQEISFDIEVASNSKDRIKDFLINVEYPFGFVFKDASPKPSFGEDTWKLSNLNSGEKRKISIRGNIVGQNNEEKVFRINSGTASEDDERVIAVGFSELTESILIKRSFIGVESSIEGKSGDVTLRGGVSATTNLTIRNNLPSRLFNASVEVEFRGAAFDKMSVFPNNGGFFQSVNNTILWDKRSAAEFADMAPGYQKTLSFGLAPLVYSQVSQGSKPEIEMIIRARGERVLESGSVEEVSAIETRKISLATDLSLSSKTVRSIGNLENTGPVPPKAETPTTYTIVWSITNSFNQVSNVEVRATLPSYVKWTNLYSPSSESLSLNAVTNEIVWNAGSVLANTGFGNSKKEVYFQLQFLPSSSQIGQSPSILGEATLSGIDKITGMKVEYTAPEATINFFGDPTFRTGDGQVVQ